MGIFDALNTSVGGLQAQSFALQNISGDIVIEIQESGDRGVIRQPLARPTRDRRHCQSPHR
jgi:hypothetical protein